MPMPARPAPTTIMAASGLLFVVAAVLLLRAVLTFVLFDDLIDAFIEGRSDSSLPREMLVDMAPGYKALAVINVVVFGGILALCGFFLLRGARWARIVATIFGVLGVLGGLVGLLQPATVLFYLLGILVAVGLLAAVVLMWLGPSSAYLRGAASHH